MADTLPTSKTEGFHILKGPDGTLYMISDANLEEHRVSKEVAPALLKAYSSQTAPGAPELGSFKILAKGTMARRTSTMMPQDTWIDTM